MAWPLTLRAAFFFLIGTTCAVPGCNSSPLPLVTYICEPACEAATACCGGGCVNVSDDDQNCGNCRVKCASGPNSRATCRLGACALDCAVGFSDCDRDPANGCETDSGSDP